MSKDVSRLYAGFHPTNYQLHIDADREGKCLTGTVTITGMKLGRPSQRLTFHQKGLAISNATIIKNDKKGDREIAVARINKQEKLQEVRLHTDELLPAGQYTATLQFEAPIQDSMHGAYFCNYEVDGVKKQLVATQFESHSAREVFPCIDEPEAKATFDLTMVTPAGEASISNMLPARQEEKDGRLTTTFETSPKMSTYLLAFAFGDLHHKEAKTKDGVLVRVWATRANRPESLDFGLDVAVRAIEFFNEYYGVPYPLAKCDHIALPDFAVGAMENWGMVTYRETCLIADPDTVGQSGRERVATVITHELSHQWFGDLVTMKWWDDLWLNESFANVMEYEAVDALFPEWHIWDSFKAGEGLSALRRDSIPGVQPVHVPVHHPDEISTLFDPSIVYAKGGRLLNMLKNYLGEDDFRKGLKQYFETHQYGNTTGDDLWKALGDASGKDVASLMNPWLTRSGFPAVSVTQKGTALDISQKHFLLDPSKADPARIWPVPLLADSPSVPALLEGRGAHLTLDTADYVQVNRGAIGHYIVHYTEPAHAANLAQAAADKALTPAERLMLLSDSSLLARGAVESFAATLRLLEHYTAEDSEPVWDIMALILADGRRFIDADASLEEPMKALVRTLIEAQFQRLGWDIKQGEHSEDTKLRATIIALGVYAEHKAITARALELWQAYQKDSTAVDSELRSIVFGAAVRHAVPGAFDTLVKLHETASDPHLKDDAMGALTSTRSPEEAGVLLGRLTDASKVKPQDVDFWLVYLLRNRYVRDVAWDWFRKNWGWIEKTFSHDQTYDNFPRYAASAFSTRHYLDEYSAFFEPKTNQQALARNIAMGIEEISNRAAWLERDLAAVQEYFGGK
ncbi:MAG TPA: M1 family metallopeptidase [Candidatus Saccharimonadales bacterium]|nr:M1 family metallopeptidase [Candidatus Saccharimonadales bacterium]